MRGIYFILFLVLLPVVVQAEKIYSNDDLLEKSEPKEVKMIHRIEGRFRVPVRYDGTVKIIISGCQSYEEGLNNRPGTLGRSVIEVNGRGRTLSEICDSVGAGCNYCGPQL